MDYEYYIVNDFENTFYVAGDSIQRIIEATGISETHATISFMKTMKCDRVARFPIDTPIEVIIEWIDYGTGSRFE
ncbi:hypothetical protein [Psychrobacillus lasiicapitis]|uniref:Uncharacterized protein n=1 Tax=Psychrobacillus lasiicapitis TaxID=1636719 RepID=A0A544TAB6_9BACI|nr:hypothetical protein [Psychrobacillus lasiicapitis]TQR14407.1 hypothetical protein FG382_08085 [Psychrobacillus lasiicapitis]GGA31629.1 hypothetical protein GCM10011384_21440 [Psychrobacillus lasiicapitis]